MFLINFWKQLSILVILKCNKFWMGFCGYSISLPDRFSSRLITPIIIHLQMGELRERCNP